MKKKIHLQQRQNKTTFTWTISSNWKKAWRNNWIFQSTTTSFLTTRVWIEDCIRNNDSVTKVIWEDLKSIGNRKQVKMEHDTERLSRLGKQWNFTDDSLHVWRVTNKEVEAPKTQRQIPSLVSSVFDLIGLCAPLSVQMRRLLKGIWINNEEHWNHEVEPIDETEFQRGKNQFPIVAGTSIDWR